MKIICVSSTQSQKSQVWLVNDVPRKEKEAIGS